jgi:ribosomal protein S27E
MPIQVSCPSCGAPVRYQSAASAIAVCPYCRSTLARDGETLKNLGRMAELLPDDSAVQLGTQGRWRGKAFAVVGRLQLRYDAGFWNEWHVLFDDGHSGWMSEASGQWTVTLPAPLPSELPTFDAIEPGFGIPIGGKPYLVTNKEEAVCLSGEGELPFVVGAGYIAPVVDLRTSSNFATLDYSSTPPTCYVGEAVTRESLALSNLRDIKREALVAAPKKKAQALSCPACGSPWAIHDRTILAMACPACGTLADVDGEIAKVRDAVRRGSVVKPPLPLGSRGKLAGREWEAIGFMRRGVPNVVGNWDEYLLYDGEGGFAWLVSERGHWNFVRVLDAPPKQMVPGEVTYGQDHFAHFADYNCEVLSVLGEFNWRVRVGEQCNVTDYIAPPRILSREKSANEITWSLGEYMTPADINAAFRLKPPLSPSSGVNACQPNPHRQKLVPMLMLFALFAVLAVVVHAALGGGRDRVLQRLQFTLQPGAENHYSSEVFHIGGEQKRLHVQHYVPVNNSWADLEVQLVNHESGQRFVGHNEISYYSGYDSDGSWSEGGQDGGVVFYGVPPGDYHVELDGELPGEANQAMTDSITLATSPPPASNLWLCLGFLALLPGFAWFRSSAFESERWSDSDHPRKRLFTSGDDD